MAEKQSGLLFRRCQLVGTCRCRKTDTNGRDISFFEALFIIVVFKFLNRKFKGVRWMP